MGKLLEFQSSTGVIFVEVEGNGDALTSMSANAAAKAAESSFEGSLEIISRIGKSFAGALERTGASTAEVTLNLKFTAEGTLFLVTTGGETGLELKLTFDRQATVEK